MRGLIDDSLASSTIFSSFFLSSALPSSFLKEVTLTDFSEVPSSESLKSRRGLSRGFGRGARETGRYYSRICDFLAVE